MTGGYTVEVDLYLQETGIVSLCDARYYSAHMTCLNSTIILVCSVSKGHVHSWETSVCLIKVNPPGKPSSLVAMS